MAQIDSLKNGMQLLELIAENGAPMSTPDLIRRCGNDEKSGDTMRHHVPDFSPMTASQVRNTIETLAGQGWLQRMSDQGATAMYGLGPKAARLWGVYVGSRIAQIEEIQRRTGEMILETQRMMARL